jgi:pyruvate/2-oxoglutarate dehydrogenase complex dihydrolipoamide acyltransferase (E2) component
VPTEQQEVKATEAAERKAAELGVDLSRVAGTGADGQVKVEDVEKAAEATAPDASASADPGGTEEKIYEAKLNPKLAEIYGPQTSVRIGDKVYEEGTPMTESEYEEISEVKVGVSVAHQNGVQPVLKGPEISGS